MIEMPARQHPCIDRLEGHSEPRAVALRFATSGAGGME